MAEVDDPEFCDSGRFHFQSAFPTLKERFGSIMEGDDLCAAAARELGQQAFNILMDYMERELLRDATC